MESMVLLPTRATEDGSYIFSLTNRRILNRNMWTLLPMSMEVTNRRSRW